MLQLNFQGVQIKSDVIKYSFTVQKKKKKNKKRKEENLGQLEFYFHDLNIKNFVA